MQHRVAGCSSLRSRASTMRVSPKSSEFAALELDVGSYPCIGAGPRALESPPPSKMSARCLPDDRIYKHVSQYKLHHAPHPAQEGEPREKTGEQDGTKKPKGEQRGKTGGTGEGRQGEPREKTGERDRTKERKPHPPPTHPPENTRKPRTAQFAPMVGGTIVNSQLGLAIDIFLTLVSESLSILAS